ncbi:hypothetical protein C2S52_010123 [Perilla frutescens var. hirtella]|uniref:Uncharacterized protein n=1 Tax=Perilla frutescens var. hirtella TaxID=608512 RepID=A0AAD4IN80_PERFH|nr:hypothetical protein C2S53_009972 [Perilla frutescens var. hirtella]KAH6778886.1 hypothetical protein C2S52_010123 [Perilla frutescens var. hirtella]KAH6816971.1 hypothetical protein C2S51_000574 [Perilla frutescens var. frutescens]
MSIFHQEPNKRCKCLASALKDAFAKCHSFRGKLPPSTPESEDPTTDFDQEEEIFVSAIISKYMESKSKRKSSSIAIDSYNWALSPAAGGYSNAAVAGNENGADNAEEFFSAGSRLSRCSSAASFDAFFSAKTCFSRCSSMSRIDFQDFDKRRSIILELIHCQGWPFGLCRKALLLPPLPKSPADSWLWTKSGRIIKING